jgi:hypothetical protein
MALPRIPSEDAEALTRSMLVGVDLSGGTSTAANDPLSTGSASKTTTPPLLEAYQKWRQRQAAVVEKAGTAQLPADAELRALRKSAKRLGKHVREGVSGPQAAVLAHQHYKKHGGKSGIEVWSRKIANPTRS